jgi:hypothetical protein
MSENQSAGACAAKTASHFDNTVIRPVVRLYLFSCCAISR